MVPAVLAIVTTLTELSIFLMVYCLPSIPVALGTYATFIGGI